MSDLLLDALRDSLKILPFLLGVYVLLVWLEMRFGDTVNQRILRAGAAGPLLGALFGGMPAHFAVMGSALYARRMVSIGTLLAVFLATSDEAVPVILSHPTHVGLLVPIVLTKVTLGIIAGFTVDLVLRRVSGPVDPPDGDLSTEVHEHGCCDHHIAERYPRLLWHPLMHTAKVFLFIFLVTLALNYLIFRVGEDRLGTYLLQHSFWQPVAAALVGLIPNCAASVVITKLFLNHDISFGSAIAGLSAGAGVGMLVLIRENRNRLNTVKILGLLLAISIAAGLLLQLLLPAWMNG